MFIEPSRGRTNMQKLAAVILSALLTISLTGAALAHSGGLNKDGCHNNRKTGGYHCHR